MVEQGFKVLADFRFDVASAVINSERLQNAVGGIGGAADSALASIKSLSMGIAAQTGLGFGSIVGLLSSAVTSADKFHQYQIKIANQFQNGGMFKGAGGFQLAMEASNDALLNMQGVARKFSLPTTDLVNTATLIGAALTSKGMENAKLSKSTDLARLYMKVAPMLGVDTGMSQGELLGLIGGRAEIGGRFVQRLFGDTKTLHQFNTTGGTAAFNKLSENKRLELLSKAMGELGNNMEAAHSMAHTLSSQIQLLKDNLFGIFTVFRDFGNLLKNAFSKMLEGINNFLATEGPKIVKNMTELVRPILENPQQALEALLQVRNARKDIQSTGKAVATGTLLLGIGHALEFIGVTAKLASPWTMAFGVSLSVFREAMARVFPILEPFLRIFTQVAGIIGTIVGIGSYIFGFATTMTFLGKALMIAGRAAVAASGIGLLVMGLFQLLSRAAAIANIADLGYLKDNLASFLGHLGNLKNALMVVGSPLIMIFESIANFISPLFRFSFLMEFVWGAMNMATKGLTLFLMGVQGVAFAIMQVMSNITDVIKGRMSVTNIGQGVTEAYDAGMRDIYDKVYGAIQKGDVSALAQNNTYVDKVEINNQFKEQMEPDRIAFALKEQLMKATANPTQASRNSLSGKSLRD